MTCFARSWGDALAIRRMCRRPNSEWSPRSDANQHPGWLSVTSCVFCITDFPEASRLWGILTGDSEGCFRFFLRNAKRAAATGETLLVSVDDIPFRRGPPGLPRGSPGALALIDLWLQLNGVMWLNEWQMVKFVFKKDHRTMTSSILKNCWLGVLLSAN